MQNLEYARNLLLTLEKDSETIYNPVQRQEILAKLAQQKQTIRRLNERLQTSPHDDDDDDDYQHEHEETGTLYSDEGSSSDVMMTGAPLGLPAYSLEGDGGSLEKSYSPSIETAGIRNRFPTHKETRAALFGDRGQAEEGEEFSEKQLDQQRVEQEDITTDMLALAQALKENSVRFSEELQKEKSVLDLASEGLDKNMLGIEGAGRKMGQLRKNQNVGWLWGILYPIIIVALVSFFPLFIPYPLSLYPLSIMVRESGLIRDTGLFHTHYTISCAETAVVTPSLVFPFVSLRSAMVSWATTFFPLIGSIVSNTTCNLPPATQRPSKSTQPKTHK